MTNRFAHPRRAIRIDAEVADLALLVDDRRAALRAVRRHLERLGARMPFLGDANHVRNDVTGAFDQDGVALADVLAPNLVEVVQGGIRNRHACELHGMKLADWSQRSDSADLHVDLLDYRLRLLRLELVRNRPARRARHLAELLLERV